MILIEFIVAREEKALGIGINYMDTSPRYGLGPWLGCLRGADVGFSDATA